MSNFIKCNVKASFVATQGAKYNTRFHSKETPSWKGVSFHFILKKQHIRDKNMDNLLAWGRILQFETPEDLYVDTSRSVLLLLPFGGSTT